MEALWKDVYPECYTVDKTGLQRVRRKFFLSSGEEVLYPNAQRSGNGYILDSASDPSKVEVVYLRELGNCYDSTYNWLSNDIARNGLRTYDNSNGKDLRVGGRKRLDPIEYEMRWIREGGEHSYPSSECIIAAKEDDSDFDWETPTTFRATATLPDNSPKVAKFENLHVDCAWVSVVDTIEVMNDLFIHARGSGKIDTRPCHGENVLRKRLISKPGDLLLYENTALLVHGNAVVVANESVNLQAGARFEVDGAAAILAKESSKIDTKTRCDTSEFFERERSLQTLYLNANKATYYSKRLPKGIAFHCGSEQWVFKDEERPSRIISRKKVKLIHPTTTEKAIPSFSVKKRATISYWADPSNMCDSMTAAHFWNYFDKCIDFHEGREKIVTCDSKDRMTHGNWVDHDSPNHLVALFRNEIPSHLLREIHLGDQKDNPEAIKRWEVVSIPNKDGPPYIYRDKDCVIRVPEDEYGQPSRSTVASRGPARTYLGYQADSLQTLSIDGDFVVECARISVLAHLKIKGTAFLRATGDVPLQTQTCYRQYRFFKNQATSSGDLIIQDGVRIETGKDFFAVAKGSSILLDNVIIRVNGVFVEIAGDKVFKEKGSSVTILGEKTIQEIQSEYSRIKSYSDTVPVHESNNFVRGQGDRTTGYLTTQLPSSINFNPVVKQWNLLHQTKANNAVVQEKGSELVPIWHEWPELMNINLAALFMSGESITHTSAHVHSLASNIFFSLHGGSNLLGTTKRVTWTSGGGFFRSTKTHWRDENYPSTITGERTYFLLPQGDLRTEAAVVNSRSLVFGKSALLSGAHVEQGTIKKKLLSTSGNILKTVEPTQFNGGSIFILSALFEAHSARFNGQYFLVQAEERFTWDTMTCSFDAFHKGITPFLSAQIPMIASMTVSPDGIQAGLQLPFVQAGEAAFADENDVAARALAVRSLVAEGKAVAKMLQGEISFVSTGLRYQHTRTHAEWPSMELSQANVVWVRSPEVTLAGGVILEGRVIDIDTKTFERRGAIAFSETQSKTASISINEFGVITGSYGYAKASKREAILPELFASTLKIRADKQLTTNNPLRSEKSMSFAISGDQISYTSKGMGRERNYAVNMAAVVNDFSTAWEVFTQDRPRASVSPRERILHSPFDLTETTYESGSYTPFSDEYGYTPVSDSDHTSLDLPFMYEPREGFAESPIPEGALELGSQPSFLKGVVKCYTDDVLKGLPRGVLGLHRRVKEGKSEFSGQEVLSSAKRFVTEDVPAWYKRFDLNEFIEDLKDPITQQKMGEQVCTLGLKKALPVPKGAKPTLKILKTVQKLGFKAEPTDDLPFLVGWDRGVDGCMSDLSQLGKRGETYSPYPAPSEVLDSLSAGISGIREFATKSSDEKIETLGEKLGYGTCLVTTINIAKKAGGKVLK